MNNLSDLRVIDTAPLPQAGDVVAFVEVIGSPPGVGFQYEDAHRNALWEVVGFGTIPARSGLSSTTLNLMLRRVKGSSPLATGCTLSRSQK